jgi:hypothetical protein
MAFDDYLSQERDRLKTQPQAPAYQFRDDRNADLDRQASAQAAAAKVNPFQAAGTGSGPFAPAKSTSGGFEGFQSDLEAGAPSPARPAGNNPFAPKDTGAQVSGAISRLLANPTGGFDQSAALARQNAVKTNQVQNEDLRNQAALSFLPGTGQGFTPIQQQTDQQTLAMRDFDARTAADRANAEQQGLQTGVSAGLQQEGQRISAEQAARQLAETSRQFNETLPIQAAQARTAAELGQGNLDVSKGQLALSGELGRGNLSLAQQQVANQVSQFASAQDFQKYALEKGLSAEQAKLAWQSNENEVGRKWTSGERLSSQEFTSLINKSSQEFESAQNTLNRALQLDVQGNAQKFEAAQTAAAQAYDKAKTEAGMSHEEAMAASQQAFAQQMQAAGFSQEQTMQATQLAQQANIAKQQMDLQETMHMADLAQNDKQFGQRLGLDYTQLAQQGAQFQQNLATQSGQWAQEFGLDKQKLDAALASEEFKTSLERAQIGMELTKNNPEAMKSFAEQLARTMGKALGFSEEQIAAGIKSGALMPTAGNTTVTNTLAEESKAIGNTQASVDRWASTRGSAEVQIGDKKATVLGIKGAGEHANTLKLSVNGKTVFYDPASGRFLNTFFAGGKEQTTYAPTLNDLLKSMGA